jgi:hypothetical protein
MKSLVEYQRSLFEEAKKEAKKKRIIKQMGIWAIIAVCVGCIIIISNQTIFIIPGGLNIFERIFFPTTLVLIIMLVVGMLLCFIPIGKISEEKINYELEKIIDKKLESHPKEINRLKEDLQNYEHDLLFLKRMKPIVKYSGEYWSRLVDDEKFSIYLTENYGNKVLLPAEYEAILRWYYK